MKKQITPCPNQTWKNSPGEKGQKSLKVSKKEKIKYKAYLKWEVGKLSLKQHAAT